MAFQTEPTFLLSVCISFLTSFNHHGTVCIYKPCGAHHYMTITAERCSFLEHGIAKTRKRGSVQGQHERGGRERGVLSTEKG